MSVKISPALVGKAGEMLVAAELMRRGVEVAHPANDVGVDLLAYRLGDGHAVPARLVPIQVKAFSGSGYVFHRRWFDRAPGVILVSVWMIPQTPEFYVFDGIEAVENALGPHAETISWREDGIWSSTSTAQGTPDWQRVQDCRDAWSRIIDKL